MRGLPPLPADVLELELTIDVNGSLCAIVQHFYSLGSIAWGFTEFSSWVSQWGTFAETHLLNMMPSSASFTTCRLSRKGTSPFRYEVLLPTNAGAHGEAQSLNSALCLTWHASADGYLSRSHTRLPLRADVVDIDKRTIDPGFLGLFQLECDNYIGQVNLITVSGYSASEFVVVSRSKNGEPRATSEFAPVYAGDPSLNVGTLRRRG